jgi:hypothetical protein
VLTLGLGVVARHKDYHLLDLAVGQAVLAATPAATCTHPDSQMTCTLLDCPAVPLSPAGPTVRLIVATPPATSEPPAVGEQRAETVDELVVSTLPSPAFSAKEVLDLSLHRGSFETVLSDEDEEQDADRWVSHTAWGQECFQILAHWLWNLRLQLGQFLAPAAVRTTMCSGSRGFARRSQCVSRSGDLWSSAVGQTLVSWRFSWLGVSPATRRHPALPC